MPKRTKRRTVRKTSRKRSFKSAWWRFFFIGSVAFLIALPVAGKLNIAPQNNDVLGEKTASEASALTAKDRKTVGRLVIVNANEFAGWACDKTAPDLALTVEFTISYVGTRSAMTQKQILGQAIANLPVSSSNVGIAAEKICPGMTQGNNHRFSFTPSGIDTSKIAIVGAYILKDGEKIRLHESPRVIRPVRPGQPTSSNSANTTTR